MNKRKKIEVIPSKENVTIDELDDINDKNNIDTIPSKFNLDDKLKINYENQDSYGLCWDFAGLKSLETYLQLHNLGNL